MQINNYLIFALVLANPAYVFLQPLNFNLCLNICEHMQRDFGFLKANTGLYIRPKVHADGVEIDHLRLNYFHSIINKMCNAALGTR